MAAKLYAIRGQDSAGVTVWSTESDSLDEARKLARRELETGDVFLVSIYLVPVQVERFSRANARLVETMR